MSDEEEEYQALDPNTFLEEYLERLEMNAKRTQLAGAMDRAAAKKKADPRNDDPTRVLHDFAKEMNARITELPTAKIQEMDDRLRMAEQRDSFRRMMQPQPPESGVEQYYREVAQRVADEMLQVRNILFQALDGANGGVPNGATVLDMAEGARQTLVAYRITSAGYRKKLMEMEALLKKLTERAEEREDSFVTLYDGVRLYVHSPSNCNDPDRCSIHNPSQHPLRNAPRAYEGGRMFRLCEHGHKHPDPDDLYFRRQLEEYGGTNDPDNDIDAHEGDCDGCCF